MNYISLIKDITGIVVSIGVSSIVGNAIKMTTDPAAKLPKKIAIGIGGIALSGMMSELAQRYTEDKIDSAVDSIETVVYAVKKKQESTDEFPGIGDVHIDEIANTEIEGDTK